ncbi:MAG: HNH endonuclease [Armatimonadetes bacterium]|nr:HNH endonuclease [Armatimonadota bacterium]
MQRRKRPEKVPSILTRGPNADGTEPDRYNRSAVREALTEMYSDGEGCVICCYCETRLAVKRQAQVEHRKPQKHFPQLKNEWTNLHFACGDCNGTKDERWDDANPILDAGIDNIECHLRYRAPDTLDFRIHYVTRRGKTTICHARLDREALEEARQGIYCVVQRYLMELIHLPGGTSTVSETSLAKELPGKFSGAHGSYLRFLWESYGLPILEKD